MENFEFENKKKKKIKKDAIYLCLCVVCLVIGGLGGYFVHDTFFKKQVPQDNQIYDEVAQTIENEFLDTAQSDYSLQERMLAGMVGMLGDPHSSYLTAKLATDLGTSINGSFQGIGVTYIAVDAGAFILQVYKDTPAQKAGLMAGDIMTHVQGTSIAGYDTDKIKEMVQGKSGTEVQIKYIRNGKNYETKAIRGQVETSVAYEIQMTHNKKVGYLQITTFGSSIPNVVENILKDMKEQGVEHLIIDLRGNGGGYLDAAQNLLNLFIPEGETMFRVQPYQGKEIVYQASAHQKYQFKEGYILVDKDSASASEVITGALKEICHYHVVGDTTYGKGTVQTQKTLSNSDILKYTYAKWLTPNGTWVHGKGIQPDDEVHKTSLSDFHIVSMDKSYSFDQVEMQIAYMQEILKELNYSVDRTDGYFSLKTQEALKAFEKDYGLKQDGIYDKNDATILLSALGYHIYHEVEDTQYQKVLELIQ